MLIGSSERIFNPNCYADVCYLYSTSRTYNKPISRLAIESLLHTRCSLHIYGESLFQAFRLEIKSSFVFASRNCDHRIYFNHDWVLQRRNFLHVYLFYFQRHKQSKNVTHRFIILINSASPEIVKINLNFFQFFFRF